MLLFYSSWKNFPRAPLPPIPALIRAMPVSAIIFNGDNSSRKSNVGVIFQRVVHIYGAVKGALCQQIPGDGGELICKSSVLRDQVFMGGMRTPGIKSYNNGGATNQRGANRELFQKWLCEEQVEIRSFWLVSEIFRKTVTCARKTQISLIVSQK